MVEGGLVISCETVSNFCLPGARTIKLFTTVIYGFSQYAGVFVPGKPSLKFLSKAGAYPRVELLKDASLG